MTPEQQLLLLHQGRIAEALALAAIWHAAGKEHRARVAMAAARALLRLRSRRPDTGSSPPPP